MKRLLSKVLFLVLIFTFVIGIFCVAAVVNSSSRVLYYGVRHDVSMLALRAQFTTLLQRLVCAIAMMISGIFCIYLYLQTYESEHFLHISVVFFLSACVIITQLDYTTLFYATSYDRKICNFCSDVFLVLFSCYILLDQTELPDSPMKYAVFGLLIVLHGALCGSRFFLQTKAFQPLLRAYAFCVCGYTVLLAIVQGMTMRSRRPLFTLLRLLPLDCILLVVSQLKFNPLSPYYDSYLKMIPYITVVYVMLLFNTRYQLHRTAVLLGRVGKRKLQEDTQYRQMALRTILLYCKKPLNALNLIAQRLAEDSNPADLSKDLQRELKNLHASIHDALQHIRIQDAALNPDMSRVSARVIFSYVREELGFDQPPMPSLDIRLSGNSDIIVGDPALLIRANHSLLSTLRDFEVPMALSVCLAEEEREIVVQIYAQYAHLSKLEMFRLIRSLKRINSVNQTIPDDELALAVAKAILAAHGARLAARQVGSNRVCLSYRLPKWRTEPAAKVCDEDHSADSICSAVNRHAVQVAILSTSARQLDFVRACLSKPSFLLMEFSDAESFLEHIRSSHVNVAIIGSLYAQVAPEELCRTIRGQYAIGLLPIILFRQNSFEPIESFYYKYINDFIYEPCSYDEMNQRILSLAMLQRSTESMRRARLEFLQAQMDPHFIFNAINAIMPMCLKDPHQAYAMLGNFSDYLRGNLFPKEENCPIRVYEEVDLIRAYLALEDARMPNRISYEIVEDYDETCEIFPLLIEPLVENCVKHGLRREAQSSAAMLHIRVAIVQNQDRMTVAVEDDGIGFDPNNPPSKPPASGKTYRSIGIDNLRKRLQLYYHASLSVDSRPGEGTRITFTISATYKNHAQ